MDKLIFTIDDQVYLNFMMGHFKKMTGYQVEVYHGGDEAVKELENKSPFMIILDHHLLDPNKDGIYFLPKIRKIKPAIPVVYITSNNTELVKLEALKAGAKSVIVKSDSFLVQLRTAMDEINSPKKGLLAKLFK
jgi:DNA-binding response OmpR family regulator